MTMATALADTVGGAFERKPATFRNQIEAGGRFAPEAGRYLLYVSYGCPWASRCAAVIQMKGLTDAIGISVVHPTWARTRPNDPADEHCGWQFRSPSDPPVASPAGYGAIPCDGCVPDPVNGARYIRDLYDLAMGGKCPPEQRYTVPVLWDTKERTIVSNESSEIVRMLNAEFNAFARNPSLDLYPPALRAEIDQINEWVYSDINNGVYKCGFATAQGPYEAAFAALFAALDRAEALLATRRFLAGSAHPTEADLRLFCTLVRFDEVYVVYFKTNKRMLREYPNLLNHTKDVYQWPGVAASVNMQHIKRHYFTSHPKMNAYAVVPVGGGGDDWASPHNRGGSWGVDDDSGDDKEDEMIA